MAFSGLLVERIREALRPQPGIVEKRMFGGVGFLLRGNLLVAVWNDSLVVRVGAEHGVTALNEPHVRPFDVTGRPMRGWVLVAPEGIEVDQQLHEWIERALQFVRTLPRK